ncbi:MAG: hypothetical protein JW751_13615 [Polyangiaceae bacterium]|nr:hypothetical protein [Polyangiaceae bacterium]
MTDDEAAFAEALGEIRRLLDGRSYEEAIVASTSALDRFPGHGRLYYSRAQAKLLAGRKSPDFVAAIEDVSRAIELSPEEPTCRFFRGVWYFELGNWNQAAEDLSEAVVLEEALGSEYYIESARLLRALALRQLGDARRAEEEVARCRPSATFYARGRLWRAADVVPVGSRPNES